LLNIENNAESVTLCIYRRSLKMEKIVILPKIPISVNTAIMTDEEIHEKLQRGYTDAEAGNARSAAEVFAKFRENH
jgi:hypothetical protein